MTKDVTRTGRGFALIASVLALLLGGYTLGFLAFVAGLPHEPGLVAASDAIVVLTGGGSRLDTAGALFERGIGQRILITGVNTAASRGVVKKLMHGGRRFDCCADLGRFAENTYGNAEEAAGWARAHGFKRLVVVTASYHMPRSLNEFSAAMPDVALVPYPVEPERVDLQEWWRHPHTIRLLQSEYDKYLASLLLTHTIGTDERRALDRVTGGGDAARTVTLRKGRAST